MHGAKEGDRERVRERDGEWERYPHNLEGEASTDHPIGEGLG